MLFDSHALTRTFILGNGGCGKTWLAHRLQVRCGHPIVHLDDLYWEPGYGGVARDKKLVADLAVTEARAERWIMEGIYGWLANIVVARVTTLIWLDLPEAECIANVRSRGLQGGETPQSQGAYFHWIADYRIRDNANSFKAHSRTFSAFPGPKALLSSRADVSAFAGSISVA